MFNNHNVHGCCSKLKTFEDCRVSVCTTLAAVAPDLAWGASCWNACLWTMGRRVRFPSRSGVAHRWPQQLSSLTILPLVENVAVFFKLLLLHFLSHFDWPKTIFLQSKMFPHKTQ